MNNLYKNISVVLLIIGMVASITAFWLLGTHNTSSDIESSSTYSIDMKDGEWDQTNFGTINSSTLNSGKICTSTLLYCSDGSNSCNTQGCTNQSIKLLEPPNQTNITVVNVTRNMSFMSIPDQTLLSTVISTVISIRVNDSRIDICKLPYNDSSKYKSSSPDDLHYRLYAVGESNCTTEFTGVGSEFVWKGINMTLNGTALKIHGVEYKNISKLSWNRDTNMMVIE